MMKIWKKTAAAVMAATMCLSFAACYNENNTWAAKKGDDTMPIGGYIYYLDNAYISAVSKVASGTEVLKGEIDGKDAKTWIKDEALTDLKSYYYILDKFNELGLELTAEEEDSIAGTADSMWTYYSGTFEPLGVAKESFTKVFSRYATLYQKVMLAMYGEGGELEVSKDDLKSYFTENYYDYEYFSASLSKTDDDGNSTDLTDDEKEDLKKELEDYADKVTDGDLTMEEAAKQYAAAQLGGEDKSTYSSSTSAGVTVSALEDAVKNGEDGKAVFVEGDSSYYVVIRHPIADKFDEYVGVESQHDSMLTSMKGEEFADLVEEKAADVEGIELNQGAMDSISLSKFVTDSNKNGTSSASSDTESSSSTSSSSVNSESSDTESSEE